MKKVTFLLIAIFVSTVACTKSTNDTQNGIVRWNITKVEGPLIGLVNQLILLTVYYPTSSGCDVLDKFELSEQGNIISVKAFGHTNTETICTQAAIDKTTTFTFKPTSAGLFELRFINRDNQYITHILTIN